MTEPTVDALALEDQVCFALALAARSVVGVYRPVLEPLGLTHPQYLVMLVLWQHRSRSVRQLSDALQLDPATLSPLLKRLQVAGLVARSRSTTDERMLEVTLTDAGRALRERATAVPGAVIDKLKIDVTELDELRSRLLRFIDAASAARAVD